MWLSIKTLNLNDPDGKFRAFPTLHKEAYSRIKPLLKQSLIFTGITKNSVRIWQEEGNRPRGAGHERERKQCVRISKIHLQRAFDGAFIFSQS